MKGQFIKVSHTLVHFAVMKQQVQVASKFTFSLYIKEKNTLAKIVRKSIQTDQHFIYTRKLHTKVQDISVKIVIYNSLKLLV